MEKSERGWSYRRKSGNSTQKFGVQGDVIVLGLEIVVLHL